MVNTIINKLCNRCNLIKEISCFVKENYLKSGYRNQCKSCCKERFRKSKYKYNRSKKGKAAMKRHKKAAYFRDPIKIKARDAFRKLVTRGKITPAKKLRCKHCNVKAIHYHHHLGYSRNHWFDVIPLCLSCHVKEHN